MKQAKGKTHKKNMDAEHHRHTKEKSEEAQNRSDSVSRRFLANYAIPFTRLVEAKLISLQDKV